MKTTLQFSEFIQSPRARVWETMLDPDSYRLWTSEFCEGSCYEGSWAQGSRIRFLAPNGDGMTSEIAENRLHERISIRHLGEVKAGVDDLESASVKDWAPAYENYTFTEAPGGTEIQVSVEVTPDFVPYMKDTFPKALRRLKSLCESGS
ncbi:MAG: SRPBCC domain-containing protein [Acidobacteria bacterium]|nr:SRPBCC domain-containing protein [Acidobacteriota bacterium]